MLKPVMFNLFLALIFHTSCSSEFNLDTDLYRKVILVNEGYHTNEVTIEIDSVVHFKTYEFRLRLVNKSGEPIQITSAHPCLSKYSNSVVNHHNEIDILLTYDPKYDYGTVHHPYWINLNKNRTVNINIRTKVVASSIPFLMSPFVKINDHNEAALLFFSEHEIDFGIVHRESVSKLEHRFEFVNISESPIIINRVFTGDGGSMAYCTTKDYIMPSDTAYIKFIQQTKYKKKMNRRIRVNGRTMDCTAKEFNYLLRAKGEIIGEDQKY